MKTYEFMFLHRERRYTKVMPYQQRDVTRVNNMMHHDVQLGRLNLFLQLRQI